MEHSKTPWKIGTPPPNGEQTIGTIDGLMVAVTTTGYGINSEANARRIVACVNACEGLTTDYLETIGLPEFVGKTLCADVVRHQLEIERASLFAESQRKQQLEQQVAELVGALEFYADRQRYLGSNQRIEAPDIYGESPSNTVYLWDVMKDGGDIARAVIQKVRGGE